MSSPPNADANLVAQWIGRSLETSRPADHVVAYDQSVRVDVREQSRLDVVVARATALDETPIRISDVLLAVDTPRSSYLHDTETKRALYARAGVPAYWIVIPEDDSPTIALAELVLDEGTKQYRYRTHYTTDVVSTDHPWPVTVDLPALTARRAKLLLRAEQS